MTPPGRGYGPDVESDPITFEPDRLLDYDDDSVLAEVQRAARLLPPGPISKESFNSVSRVSATTCRRRFGSWKATLERAGLENRYGGPASISPKMLSCQSRFLSNEEVLAELRRVAEELGGASLTVGQVNEHSEIISSGVVRSRFGSWGAGLAAAGLTSPPHGNRWTEDDYFENLLAVWTHRRRAPRYAEMRSQPSVIGGSAYVKRFGSWTAAKHAFAERINSDLDRSPAQDKRTRQDGNPVPGTRRTQRAEDQKDIRLGLRYEVLRRDRFRCVTCGRSPATDLTCVLQVDHVVPFSKGGKTTIENLRSLCDDCNLGKGDRPA